VFAGHLTSSSVPIDLTSLQHYPAIMTYLSTNAGFSGVTVSLSSRKEGETRRAMVVEAVRSAKSKAQAIAKDNGVVLAGLLAVEESPAAAVSEVGSLTGNYRGPPEQTSRGQLSLSVTVSVTARFEIRNGSMKALETTSTTATPPAVAGDHAKRAPGSS
jgi:uncharacterized protein YggE